MEWNGMTEVTLKIVIKLFNPAKYVQVPSHIDINIRGTIQTSSFLLLLYGDIYLGNERDMYYIY